MAEVILMPRLSDTMTEGVIAAWHKNIGDMVNKGDLLADIETDKATMELESYQFGMLLYQGAPVGGKIQVNELLAIVGKEGEDISALIANPTATKKTQETKLSGKKIEEPAPQSKHETSETPATTAISDEVVLMPRLSDTMTEGVIAAWHKNVGDTVEKGEVLADIETDKATMELESYKGGVLLYQGAKEGEKVAVNDLLCIIGKEGLDVNAIIASMKSEEQQDEKPEPAETIADPEVQPVMQNTKQETPIINEGRILASPLAKKIAEEKGIDLKYVQGTGDGGRIIKNDVDNYVPAVSSKPQTTGSSQPPIEQKQITTSNNISAADNEQSSFDEIPVSQMRKAIARRLSESMFTAPHFYLTMSINMDAAVAARAKINEDKNIKISFNDLVLKATALALKQHPKVTSSWLGETIRFNHHINIGVAVAVEEGLLVPVVKDADKLSLSEISAQVKTFAQKAKDKKLQPSDWEGNTFTISNLGMFGIDEFTAIINPPDACILAIGGISQVPVVKNNQVVPGNVMKVTLSADHRVVDGATGAAFLQTLKALLEEPLRMLV